MRLRACVCVSMCLLTFNIGTLQYCVSFLYSLLHCTLTPACCCPRLLDVRRRRRPLLQHVYVDRLRLSAWLGLNAREVERAFAFAFAFTDFAFAFAVAFTVALPVRCVALLKHECSCSGAAALCALGSKSSALLLSFFALSLSALSRCVCVRARCVELACDCLLSLCGHRCCCCCCRCCCFSCWFTLAPAPALLLLLLPSQLRAAPSEFA